MNDAKIKVSAPVMSKQPLFQLTYQHMENFPQSFSLVKHLNLKHQRRQDRKNSGHEPFQKTSEAPFTLLRPSRTFSFMTSNLSVFHLDHLEDDFILLNRLWDLCDSYTHGQVSVSVKPSPKHNHPALTIDLCGLLEDVYRKHRGQDEGDWGWDGSQSHPMSLKAPLRRCFPVSFNVDLPGGAVSSSYVKLSSNGVQGERENHSAFWSHDTVRDLK